MSPRLLQNFRGMLAAVLHAPDRNRQVLTETLRKLGLRVTEIDGQLGEAVPSDLLDHVDILFFDADAPEPVLGPAGGVAPIPVVALLGLETPSRLQRAFELQPAAVLHKPLRPTGIYTALFFAANEHRRRQQTDTQRQALEARHAARRFVIKAVVTLMERRGIDEDQAYRLLRRESMRQRLTIEELAVRIAAIGPDEAARNARRA